MLKCSGTAHCTSAAWFTTSVRMDSTRRACGTTRCAEGTAFGRRAICGVKVQPMTSCHPHPAGGKKKSVMRGRGACLPLLHCLTTSCLCAEISCGPPLTLPNTNLLWNGTSAPGSVLLYECMDGFYQESGNGTSMCLTSGEWARVSVKCKGTVTKPHRRRCWKCGDTFLE